MGVYIPPPSESGSSSDDKEDKKGQSKNSSDTTTSTDSSLTISSESTDTSRVESFIRKYIPENPSFGLIFWGPFKPAPDNRPALYICTGTQLIASGILFNNFRKLRRYPQLSGPDKYMKGYSIFLSLIFGIGSSLEFLRLRIGNDPWYDEAQYQRRLAIKNGSKPTWWWGAIRQYKPMSFNTWLDEFSKDTYHQILHRQIYENPELHQKTTPLPDNDKFKEAYEHIKGRNDKASHDSLEGELKDVNELNKASRLDDLMEGKGKVQLNEHYAKSPIQLGNHSIESDDDLELVWYNFEPWDELKSDTTYDVRLIPKCRVINEEGNPTHQS